MSNLNHSEELAARIPAPIYHTRAEPLINTGALARWKDAPSPWELFQQFVASSRKPLKRLIRPRTSLHRAEAPVLMRTCWNACGICGLGAALFLACAGSALADVRYVDVNSTNSTPPYTNWATAATNIQDAVDAALAGDEVVVTNGIYATGGRSVDGYTTNRVAVDKALALRSVSGPRFTTIDGRGELRCVYLTTNASLSGFSLTNGMADFGGGVNGGGTLTNCTLAGNYGLRYYDEGGGAYGEGGGAFNATLNNCTLVGNSAYGDGSGASGCILNNCALTGNYGQGAIRCILHNCSVTRNSGGGAWSSTLDNCTLTGNAGFGAVNSTLNNCIAYFNTPDGRGAGLYGVANYVDYSCTLNYCCTTPLPTKGVGNISADPQLASASHLGAASPCRGAGNTAYASGTDIDGETWASPPSIGCDEYHAGAVIGPLNVSLTASFLNVLPGYTVQLAALIEGRTTASSWDFGDGITATNQPYTTHAWTELGEYTVVLRAFNESQPGGISATVSVHVVVQPVHYVAATSANPEAPYTSWATAATNIQDAVDAATVPGALVLVTNGIYGPVSVGHSLTLRSLNGPQSTTIDGGHLTRCVSLTDGASLSGFTLTNGVAHHGGGLWCQSTNSVASNCVVSGNAVFDSINSFSSGGGAFGGTLNNCIIRDNRSLSFEGDDYGYGQGGGAAACILNKCTITNNFPGGAYYCTLNNCTLSGNSWGAGYCTLNNCALSGNSGTGAGACTLNNCTLTGNSDGGATGSTLNNCIVYFNTAQGAANYDSYSTLNYCCTTPQPTHGIGNTSLDPQLASAWHLSAGSPCRGAGNAAYATGTDIDGEAWASPPSIGCDEYHPGSLTGPMNVDLILSFTNVATGYPVQLTALIGGNATACSWDFGDGITVTNQPYASHAWMAPGDYPAVLRAYNEAQPGGISATATVHVVTGVHYVAPGGNNPAAPYTSWATAATNIQDAVDAAIEPGSLVWVTNGIYGPIKVYTPLSVRSIHGAPFTIIDGRHSKPCVSLGNAASLSGFTLTNGVASNGFGGGASGGTLNDCILSGNSAYEGGGADYCTLNNCTLNRNSATYGGGAESSTLNNCVLTGNSANEGGGADGCTLNNCVLTGNSANEGGGADGCTLNNCTVTGNSTWDALCCDQFGGPVPGHGGGVRGSTVNNCIIYFNTSTNAANCDSSSTLNYSCTTPQPTNGIGNITNAPLFVDTNGWANLRLQSNSPCINAGLNTLAPTGPDLDGNPRIAGGTVDIGAYEFQSPTSIISYAWLQQYGLPTDGSADAADPDGDGVDNYHEWLASTDPSNPFSSPAQLTIIPSGTNVILTWSTNAVGFALQSTGNPAAPTVWSTNSPAPVVIGGQNVVTNPIIGAQQFYRLIQ